MEKILDAATVLPLETPTDPHDIVGPSGNASGGSAAAAAGVAAP